MSERSTKNAGDRRIASKWKITAGSAAACAMYMGTCPSADADIVHFNTPITIGIGGGTVDWDVDGDATADFTLATFASTSLSINGGGAFVNLLGSSFDGIEGFAPVASQFDVGPTLPASYFFGYNNATFRTMMTSGGANLGPDASNWDAPTQYVAFRFGNTFYGWASVTLDTANATLTVNEWAFENTGAAIHLGAISSVPEPSAGGLALLASGAAGISRWRRRKLSA
jgi:hypothetical protein